MNAILAPNKPAIITPPICVLPKRSPIRQTLVLLNHQGLHCRPAALLVQTLEDFNCKVIVESHGTLVDGRSILGLLSLAAGFGTRITFVVTGPEAKEAMAAIQQLFEKSFAGAYEQNGSPRRSELKFNGMIVGSSRKVCFELS
jgi:phosphocarrier protein HPr